MAKSKRTHRQTMTYKTISRKNKFEQQEHKNKPGVNSCAIEGLAVPTPLDGHVV